MSNIEKKDDDREYTSEKLHEFVLREPDVHIGSSTDGSVVTHLFRDEKVTYEEIPLNPGLYKLFDEILVNAADQVVQDPTCNNIHVTFNRTTGQISVRNNGRGIPLYSKDGVPVPELIFGKLLTTSNSNKDGRITGGKNGLGAKLANIFSFEFEIELVTDGKFYGQRWTSNMYEREDPVIKNARGKDYVKVSFIPDYPKFGHNITDKDEESKRFFEYFELLLFRRCNDISACTRKDVTVYFEVFDKRAKSKEDKICPKNLLQYAKHWPEFGDVTYAHQTVTEKKIVGDSEIDMEWEFLVFLSSEQSSFRHVSFVNNCWTMDGGTHVNNIASRVANAISAKLKDKKIDVPVSAIKKKMTLFLRSTVISPSFQSQTKDFLSTPVANYGIKIFIQENFINKLVRSSVIRDIVSVVDASKLDKENKISDSKKSSNVKIEKYDAAKKAGTRESEKCTIMFTEGDSARAIAMYGRSVLGADYFGVYSLRGKLKNVKGITADGVRKNGEIHNMKRILGISNTEDYEDVSKLNYGRILVCTDADDDGYHILSLISNVFHTWWPSLFYRPGFINLFSTPVVKAYGPKKECREFFTEKDAKDFYKNNPKYRLKYYKGLGTNTPKEAVQLFKRYEELRIEFYKTDECNDAMELAFNKARADDRKVWIAGYDEEKVHPLTKRTSYSELVFGPLVRHSYNNCVRSICSSIDGLKPSQRKVLYTMFTKNIRKTMKVNEISGSTISTAEYHHGDSLAGTITKMAQNFWCSNGIEIIEPDGIFGTRSAGGDDAASGRYIGSHLRDITSLVFPKVDFSLLKYEPGESNPTIEPNYYVPVVPLSIINGSIGIGTGWSSNVPQHNPLDMIQRIRDRINGIEYKEVKPWYRQFRGTIEKSGKSYVSIGNYEILKTKEDEPFVRVTELPVEKWTDKYISFLNGLLFDKKAAVKDQKKQILRDYTSSCTSELVSFDLWFENPNLIQELVNEDLLEKKLGLRSSISFTNMVMFDSNGVIYKYSTIKEIFDEFYRTRHRLYIARKEHMLNEHRRNKVILSNKYRFITEILEGYDDSSKGLHIFRKKKDVIDALLKERNYDVHPVHENYEYLTGMPISSMTQEEIEKLARKQEVLRKDIESLEATSPEQLWLDDLEELEKELLKCPDYTAMYERPERPKKTEGYVKKKGKKDSEFFDETEEEKMEDYEMTGEHESDSEKPKRGRKKKD